LFSLVITMLPIHLNYPDRTTAKGNGDETEEIDSPVTHAKETIHSYGWYLRQYVKDAKDKGRSA
jgi:hypothetical protein